MDCINPDGSLGTSARTILASLIQPASLDDIARNNNMPVHQIRQCLKELLQAGLVAESHGIYRITDIGLALLQVVPVEAEIQGADGNAGFFEAQDVLRQPLG